MSRLIDILPESLSQIGKGIWWTIGTWIASFVVLWLMCQCGEPWIAFCACACLVMVGVLPLKKDSKNIAHYVFAVGAAVLSQLWCGLVGDWFWLVMWWAVYLALLPLYRSKWCFVAEVFCVVSVLITISIYF